MKPSKTYKSVVIPAAATFKSFLDGLTKKGSLILTNTWDHPRTSDSFKSSWAKALARAGVTGLTSHDLRRMAVTRLALSGCTVPEIAAITGHSLRDVEVILVELTESAVLKLESGWAKTKPTSQLTNG